MVRSHCRYIITLLMFMLPSLLYSQEVVVTASIEGDGIVGEPIIGNITVTHDRNIAVDEESFRLDNRRLNVELIKEVKFSDTSDLVISVYRFQLEPRQSGLHELPEIAVKVGRDTYRSISSTYVVQDKGKQIQAPTGTSKKNGLSLILELENIIEGKTKLYPKQQLIVGYRFIYNYSFDLSKEELPLLRAEGFQKVGGKDTKQFQKEGLNYLEARQIIEAVKPGEYQFPGGQVVGRAYSTDRLGVKSVAPVDSQAETESVTLVVVPFPKVGRPPSFNGAIGTSLTFEMDLLSSDTVTEGDKIALQIKISGEGELSTLPMPEVCCQPGFSGFFRLSDLPPIERLANSEKIFVVEMRPLTSSITEIPSLEFSYFNPEGESYQVLKSSPIPLKVNPLKGEPTEEQRQVLFEQKDQGLDLPDSEVLESELIPITGNYSLSEKSLRSCPFGTWWVLLIIPLGVGFILLQIHFKNYMEENKNRVKKVTSRDYFNQAIKQKLGDSEFFNLVQKAFLLRLVERGDIPSEEITPDYLPPGKVRELLREIDEKRFSSGEETLDADMIKKIKKVFREIDEKGSNS